MMTDMCLRIDGLPQATKGYTLLPFQGEQWYERHYPGCRFALPWAMGCCPFGACFQMHVYYDHLEIWNEGELPLGYTEETLMGRHSSKPRNRNIANAMFKAGFIDTWGRGYMKIREGFTAAGIPMPKVPNFCGGVQVSVQRSKFMEMMNVADNVTSLSQVVSQVVSQVEQIDNEHYKASLSQVVSQVVSQVMSQVNVTDLRLLTEVFISLQQERNLSELMIEFGQTNRTRFKSSCLNILIRAGLATPTIPDKPNSRFQKYVLTEKGKELIESVSGTNFS